MAIVDKATYKEGQPISLGELIAIFPDFAHPDNSALSYLQENLKVVKNSDGELIIIGGISPRETILHLQPCILQLTVGEIKKDFVVKWWGGPVLQPRDKDHMNPELGIITHRGKFGPDQKLYFKPPFGQPPTLTLINKGLGFEKATSIQLNPATYQAEKLDSINESLIHSRLTGFEYDPDSSLVVTHWHRYSGTSRIVVPASINQINFPRV